MRNFFLGIAAILCWPSMALSSPAKAQVHYVGFNDFIDNIDDVDAVFSNYTKTIIPIMGRYGLTLKTYRVTYSLGNTITANAITFGTAPDIESFQAFFADPDFQAAFPKLVGIIENHTVVFTDGSFAPKMVEDHHTMIRLDWLKEPIDNNYAALEKLDESLRGLWKTYGVTQIASAHGVTANAGLAGEIKTVPAPQRMVIRNFRDAHDYLEQESVENVHEAMKKHVLTSSIFWIEPW